MLQRKAKTLGPKQVAAVLIHIAGTRHPSRNRVVFLLSLRAGLRAKEIAALTWAMITDPQGMLSDAIHLPNSAAKGASGGVIPMSRDLREALSELQSVVPRSHPSDRVVETERAGRASAQVIINLFRRWYRALAFDGCSSHSGRRTFITNAARNIGRVGGSLRDVQALARHASLGTTQGYIEISADAMRRVVDL
jgi:integrase/recombinase XerD